MEGLSIVSKGRTAFHSATAKAEKVFTDIKISDFTTANPDSYKHPPKSNKSNSPEDDDTHSKSNEVKNSRRRPEPIKTKRDWHERLKNIRIGKRGVQDIEKADNSTMSFAIFDENLYLPSVIDDPPSKGSRRDLKGSNATDRDIIPPTAVIKQLAIAFEAGKNFKSMKDILASVRDASPSREKAGLSFSAMKSIVLREKEEKFASEFGVENKLFSLINSFPNAEGHFSGYGLETITNTASLPREIHGAPPESFVVKLSETIGSLKTLRQMASFWLRVTAELRRLWSEEQYVPGIPPDEVPDLNSCLLYQQLQVINCCVSRKRRHSAATESLDSIMRLADSNVEQTTVSEGAVPASALLYAKLSNGELVLRLGADKQFENLAMLATGETVYAPVMQEGPLLTEDLIKETEEFVLRTGSVGAGCSQLLSDMQAFKAANPGCIFEDFVRWHSPPDWMETESSLEAEETLDGGDLLSAKGQLSSRMQKEGNLWRELWVTSKPIPAVKQSPLYDEDLAVEGILNFLEDIPPSALFEQQFISLLGSRLVIAESALSTNSSLTKLFYECKDYIVAACQGCIMVEKVDDICQVYETVEMMLSKPDEVIKMMQQQTEETTPSGDNKSRFKRLSLIFRGNDRHSGKPPAKDLKSPEDNPLRQSFSSIFSKKPPKPGSASPGDKPVCPIQNDWSVV